MKINIVEWFAMQKLWEPFFVVAERRFSLLKSKSCLRFRQNIHLYISINGWNMIEQEREPHCVRNVEVISIPLFEYFIYQKSQMWKMKLFFVLSSLYAMWCDVNADSWQMLKLTRKTAHSTPNSRWNVNIGRERHTLYNKHTAIPYDTMQYVYLGCVPCRCVWIKRKWRAPCMKRETGTHSKEENFHKTKIVKQRLDVDGQV